MMDIQIAVLIKAVPDLSKATISKSQGLLIEKGPKIMRPADRNALEFALQIVEKEKGEVTALTLASAEGEVVLKEAMALGADRTIILSDPSFLGGDETSVATALGHALLKLKPDLVLCGEGPVGHRIAEVMKIGSIHSVIGVETENGAITVKRKEVPEPKRFSNSSPPLLSVLAGSNVPRIANVLKIMKASKKEISRWAPSEIGVSEVEIGAAGAGLRTLRVFSQDA